MSTEISLVSLKLAALRTCAYPDCGLPSASRGRNRFGGIKYGKYCYAHSKILVNTNPRCKTVEELYWSHVTKEPHPKGCWGWNSKKIPYGTFKAVVDGKRKMLLAHRVSWELHYGPIPKGLWVLHSCDNAACSNFEHLHLGTPAQNSAEMKARGRAATGDRNASRLYPEKQVRGETCPAAKTTEDQVRQIRALRNQGLMLAEIGQMFSMTYQNVRSICTRHTWAHVD